MEWLVDKKLVYWLQNYVCPPSCYFPYFYSHPISNSLSHIYDEVSQYLSRPTAIQEILVKMVELYVLFKNDKSNAKTLLNSSVPADSLTFMKYLKYIDKIIYLIITARHLCCIIVFIY